MNSMIPIPLRNLKKDKIIYHIPLNSDTIKFEINVPVDEYGKKGWRILINNNSPALPISQGSYIFPVQRNAGKVVFFNDFYLSKEKTPPIVENPQEQQAHPSTIKFYKFIKKNCQDPKYLSSVIEINQKRGEKNSKVNWSILRVNGFPDDTPFPLNKNMIFLNPQEYDLLSLDDLNDIEFMPIKISSMQIAKIDSYLNKMGLNYDTPAIGGKRTIRELIETFTGIEEIKQGKFPTKSGLALYGPPGTGKTYLIESSLKEIFREGGVLDFNWHFAEIGKILSNHYVGGFAANVSKLIFEPAIEKVKKTRKPCFIYIDEATDLLKKPDHEWLAQGIEAMKSFINKNRYPGIIVCLASNMDLEDMDDALTREGRLKPIEIPLPSEGRSRQIWQFVNNEVLFSKKFKGQRFSEEEIERLVNLTSKKISIASITEISAAYKTTYKLEENEIVFEKFIKQFGEEVLVLIEKEHNKKVKNLKEIKKGVGYFDPEEIKKKEKGEKEKYKKIIYEIKKTLDPSLPTFREGVTILFKGFFSKKKDTPKKYNELKKILITWIKYLEINSDNPFNDKSNEMITKAINNLIFLEESLNKEIFYKINLSEILDLLTRLKTIKENPHNFNQFTSDDLHNLETLIINLPEEKNIFENNLLNYDNSIENPSQLDSENYFKILEEGINILNKFDRENQNQKKLDDIEIQRLVNISKTLEILKNNINEYFKDEGNIKNLISFSLIQLNKLERDKYLTSTDYTNLRSYLLTIIENKK